MSQTMLDPIVFVLRHTHWDREWYHPAVVFRKRVVDLIDDLLTAPNGPFLLDGQAIVLQDYLTVRPERAAEVAAALRGGRLEAGPWFVLPDELIPGGEALVRNLLAGRRALRTFRAAPPRVLYCPDSFGHAAALPTIAAGFGCSTAIVWRGYGSRRFPPGDAAAWVGADDARVVLFHLPPDGYEFGCNLPATDREARRRWDAMRKVLRARSTLGVWLVPNGADHHAPQRDGGAAIAALTRAAAPVRVTLGGLDALGELLQQRAAAASLPLVRGELRDSYGYAWTLPGTLATRAHQKRRNAQLERLLVRDVEPWGALARLAGQPSTRQHVHNAWETLLTCHPHDSLCGCSIDAVAESVDARMADVDALAVELRRASLSALIGHDPDAVRADPAAWQSAVLVRNRAIRPRGGLAELDVDVPLAYVPVGPGSTGRRRELTAPDSLPVPTQVLEREHRYERIEAPRFYPMSYDIERRRCLAWVPPVPSYGLVALALTERSTPGPVPHDAVVGAEGRSVHSALGDLTISRAAVVWRARGSRAARALVRFESRRDHGDTYTPSLAPGAALRAVAGRARVALRGPLRAAIDTPCRFGSGRKRAGIELTTRLALDAGAQFIRVSVRGVNSATDHRLRIVFATGLRPRRVVADAAFALVERKPLRVPAADRRAEMPLPTAPLHRFVTVFDGKRGCTVVSDGLSEYEVLETGEVAITLVRSVGELSRNDLPERPGHAGWPSPTPAAQCIGPFEAAFAIAWHGGDSPATRSTILETVDDVLLPLTGETRRDLASLPPVIAGVALEGEGLAFSTLKESDNGEYLVARCTNVTGRDVQGAWILPRPITRAQHGRLDETPLAPIAIDGTRIPVHVAPYGVATVLIAPDDVR